VVAVLVVVKVTGSTGAPAPGTQTPAVVAASPAVLDDVMHVPASVANAVGLPSSVVAPTVDRSRPPLVLDHKPGVLYIGAEFCPACAAERWAMVMALSKFGVFAHLEQTTSSPWDSDPSTATFSFRGATFTSDVLTLHAVEHQTNDTDGIGTRKLLEPLTAQESTLWAAYSAKYSGGEEGYPFLDIGNRVIVIGPSYNGSVLQGLDHADIASKLSNASDPVTQAIVGTSNYLTGALCSITGGMPSSVCTQGVVPKATHAIDAGG